MELHYTWFNEKEPVLLEYSGVVYLFFVIRVLSEYESSAFLNYEYLSALDESVNSCKIMCNKEDCPHYKASLGKTYNDGTKEVMCSFWFTYYV